MNILIVGGDESFFFGSIVDKLLKENHKVFHIAGAAKTRRSGNLRRVVTYNIDLDDAYVQFVVQSVAPDAIIYMGAYDDRHVWKDYHRSSAKYISELTNILVSAADMNVKKFIYLSTINVYGFLNEGILTEETPLSPSNVKSIIVAQGERLCMDFDSNNRISSTILRFGQVYGDLHLKNIRLDYVMQKSLGALNDGKLVANNQRFPLIYVSDAAIAVFKAVTLGDEGGIYNVCDDETVTDRQICECIRDSYDDRDIEIEQDNAYTPQNFSLDGSKFNRDYQFFQKTKYKEGIKNVAGYVAENRQRLNRTLNANAPTEEEEQARSVFKTILKRLVPYAESVLVFALFFALEYVLKNVLSLRGIDMMVLYVVIVSVTFGRVQAVVSIVMAVGYYIGIEMTGGMDFVSVIISTDFVQRLLFLVLVGLVVGQVRDRWHETIDSDAHYIEHLESEYNKLDEINDVTVTIKQELEERMLTYSDSLAKNYAIIEELDSLLPERVYLKALEVIQTLLKTESVCVYVRNPRDDQLTLAYWTDEESKKLGEHIDLRYIPEMYESFVGDAVFTNKQISQSLPLLAGQVQAEETVQAVVMVWSLRFESLTMYHTNLFVTLMKIVNHSIERAFLYHHTLGELYDATNPGLRDAGANLVQKDFFTQAVATAEEARAQYAIPYSVIRLRLGNTPVVKVITDLGPLLTGMYYMYWEDDKLDLLLQGTDIDNVSSFLTAPKNAQGQLQHAAGRTRTEGGME